MPTDLTALTEAINKARETLERLTALAETAADDAPEPDRFMYEPYEAEAEEDEDEDDGPPKDWDAIRGHGQEILEARFLCDTPIDNPSPEQVEAMRAARRLLDLETARQHGITVPA